MRYMAFAAILLSATAARADRYGRGLFAFQSHCAHCHSVGWKQADAARKQSRVDLTRVVDKRDDVNLRDWLGDTSERKQKSPCQHASLTRTQIDDLIHFLHARAGAQPPMRQATVRK